MLDLLLVTSDGDKKDRSDVFSFGLPCCFCVSGVVAGWFICISGMIVNSFTVGVCISVSLVGSLTVVVCVSVSLVSSLTVGD